MRHPSWLPGAIIYEINTRTFSPEGNFRGVLAGLDRLQKLGVTILWLMPVHPSGKLKAKGKGSPYAVRDYFGIHPDYGTAADLHQLIAEAHRLGFRVIIDIVANHTSWDSVLMEHPDFYRRDAKGDVVSPEDWTDVAALNYANPKLREYMIDMLKFWLREFDLDGFRCDVAGMVPTDFWEQARPELESVKRDLFLLAEWDSPDLLRNAFNMDYSWPLHKTLNQVMMHGAPASSLRRTWEEQRTRFPEGALHMRFSDNHDEERAIARFGEPGALAASTLMFTLDGVPLLYNGMEVGDSTESGAPALFYRLPVFWEIAQRRSQFARFYSEMIPLRKQHEALQQGALEWLGNSDDARVLSFLRRDANEQFLIAINLSSQPWEGTIDATGAHYADVTPRISDHAPTPVDLPKCNLTAWGFRMFRSETRR